MEFHKGQTEDLYYSIYTLMIFSTSLKMLILQILLTITHCIYTKNKDVIFALECDSNNLYQQYTLNYLKPNTDKYHLLLSSQDANVSVTINNENILNCKQEKLLGVTIDNEFSCLPHVRNICKQASKKFHALSRICKFMTQDKRRMIMKAFIDSQFNYWPLVWIFHKNRGINNTMNKIHGRVLRMVYNDDSSSYDELLLKDNTFTIHQRN